MSCDNNLFVQGYLAAVPGGVHHTDFSCEKLAEPNPAPRIDADEPWAGSECGNGVFDEFFSLRIKPGYIVSVQVRKPDVSILPVFNHPIGRRIGCRWLKLLYFPGLRVQYADFVTVKTAEPNIVFFVDQNSSNAWGIGGFVCFGFAGAWI